MKKPARIRLGRFRLLLGAVLTATALVGVGVVGGISYAKPTKSKTPSPAQAQYGKAKRAFLRSSLVAAPGWALREGTADARRHKKKGVRVFVRFRGLHSTTGSGTTVDVRLFCGATLAGTSRAKALSRRREMRFDVVFSSGVPRPCLNPSISVFANGTALAATTAI